MQYENVRKKRDGNVENDYDDDDVDDSKKREDDWTYEESTYCEKIDLF